MEAEDLERAQTVLERSLAMQLSLHGDDHPDVAESHASLGDFLARTGDVAAAQEHLLRARGIQERHLGADDPRLASTLSTLAKLDQRRGRYADAARLLEQVLAILRRAVGAEHPEVASTLDLLARVSFATGDFESARQRWRRSLELKQRLLGAEHPEVATLLNNLASLSLAVGDYVEAQRLFERAASIYENTLGPEHSFVASTHSNLGRVYHKTGDYESAREHYQLALELKEQSLGKNHPSLGATLVGFAAVLRDLHDDVAASMLYERALDLYERTLGGGHPNVALIANSLALSLARAGDVPAAESYFRRAIEIYQGSSGPNHPNVAKVIGNLATLHRDSGSPGRARSLYARALEIERQAVGDQHPEVARLLTERAILDYRAGDTGQALEAALEAERIGRSHLRLTILTLPERRALRFAAVRAAGLDLALSMAARGDAQDSLVAVWQSLLATRSLVLDEMAARSRAAWASRREGAQAALAELQAASEALARLLVEEIAGDDSGTRREELQRARRRHEAAERALAESSASFRRERGRAALALGDVVAVLPEKSALLAYARYRRIPRHRDQGPVVTAAESSPAYLAFVLAPGTNEPVAVDLGPADEIDALVSSWWREAAQSPAAGGWSEDEGLRRYRRQGDALRTAVWDPIAGLVADAERVFVVADGLLHLVNLAALPSTGDGYLLDEGPLLHLVSSERELVPLHEATGSGLLALGAPAFDRVADHDPSAARATGAPIRRGLAGGCSSLDELRFGELPGALREIDDVVALWQPSAEGPVFRLQGASASEEALKRLAAGRRVLHLATHGFFFGADCPAAGVGTRGVGGLTASRSLATGADEATNPLLLSGLALAGANQRGERSEGEEDGILTAEELANLDLAGVEWAVLSACDTALGPVADGEGVFGLRRALRIAGVRTVILSLWSVEDEAARSFMRHLYGARMREGLDTSRALRQAARRSLAERRASGASSHPFYWAGFVASGEWR
jgi:CHAT domain-containing protein/tetratricopeptide (TPR) repeat protein